MVLETENSKIKHLQIQSLSGAPLPSSKKAIFSLSPHMAERGGSSLESLYKGTDPIFIRAPTLMTHDLITHQGHL